MSLEQLFGSLNITPEMARIVGLWVSVLLTVAVLSYLLGNNGLYRFAQYLFAGTVAGYAGALAWAQVLWPRIQLLIGDPLTFWRVALFMLLGLLLLARGVRSLSPLANVPLALLFGVGAGLALVGALRGTIWPQIRTAMGAPTQAVAVQTPGGEIAALVIMALCTILALSAFHHRSPAKGDSGWIHRFVGGLGAVGRVLIWILFGVIIAGAAITFFLALQGRVEFLFDAWRDLLPNMGF